MTVAKLRKPLPASRMAVADFCGALPCPAFKGRTREWRLSAARRAALAYFRTGPTQALTSPMLGMGCWAGESNSFWVLMVRTVRADSPMNSMARQS